MTPAVRAIIQFPYRGAQGEKPGTLLELQYHPRHGYSYILPGGSMEPGDKSRRRRLQTELREELGIDVSTQDMEHLYSMKGPTRATDFYFVHGIRGGKLRINPQEVKGLGVYGASSRIPGELMTGNVAKLKDDFYRGFPNLIRDVRRELIIPTGYFNPSALNRDVGRGIIPTGTVDWDSQRQQWPAWEAEVQRNRGIPPLNNS